ncbi:JmjC domain-containing protein [Streptomyces sp. NPDC051561]|uniref:JmjC domain-containing protein n=1 Tax=Streptomyces sp. NPDC051561 TaxID=3365658 RepID=UPI0037ADE245
MSLSLLLPEKAVSALLEGPWPEAPSVHERGSAGLDRICTPEFFDDWVFTGCVPADEIAVVKAPSPSLNPAAIKTNGRTDGAKLRRLYEQGFTVRLGNLQRVVPELHAISREIQVETGYSNYVHAFLTPASSQGLRHHWDQQVAIIAQMSGVKRWQLWKPVVEAPMRHFNESTRVWDEGWRERWVELGPDLEVELLPGQSLIVPRGWVHNPLTPDATEGSCHLTFALRERTPYWLAERLLEELLGRPEFRRVLLPESVIGGGLAGSLHEVRRMLADAFSEKADVEGIANKIRDAARSELEYTT